MSNEKYNFSQKPHNPIDNCCRNTQILSITLYTFLQKLSIGKYNFLQKLHNPTDNFRKNRPFSRLLKNQSNTKPVPLLQQLSQKCRHVERNALRLSILLIVFGVNQYAVANTRGIFLTKSI